MANLAIFASGRGSNADAIIRYLKESRHNVVLILSNRKKAGVHDVAESFGIPSVYLNKECWAEKGKVLEVLQQYEVDWISLAGFLIKIPMEILMAYKDRMVNIHPSLLPKYGGKGMFGSHVHTAVMNNKESRSGITIHLVNEEYDQGEIIFQAAIEISEKDGIEDLLQSIHEHEHKYYPKVINLIMQ